MVRGKCPKDGNELQFNLESEKLSNGVVRTTLIMKCPVCGYKIVVERIEAIRDKDGNIILKRFFPPDKT
ncbi:MAG: hypothetical protein QXP68_01515 [Thermosphaera sp.]